MAKKGLIKRADGSVISNDGCMMCSAPQGKTYSSSRDTLPARVDLRGQMTPIENQGNLNSCTANATAGAVEHLLKTAEGIEVDVSRLFIYYNARAYDNPNNLSDNGSRIDYAVKSLDEYGVCTENRWYYNGKYVNTCPTDDCYEEAEEIKITDYEHVPLNLQAWKQALAEGHPIIFGTKLFNSFYNQRRPGLIDMPQGNESQLKTHGSHAMLCVGYSDADQLFIVRNSWGTNWGDRGYCYMPYQYLMKPEWNTAGGGGWVLYSSDSYDDYEENWDDDDDESLVPDIETAFSYMDEDTWSELCDECGDYDIIYRIGGLYVAAACMDGEFNEDEQQEAIDRLQTIINFFGVKMKAKKVIKNCLELAQDQEFLTSTMEIFAKYLNDSLKLTILNDMKEIAGSDDLDEEEEEFIKDMAEIFDIKESTMALGLDIDDYWDDDDDDDDDDDWDDDDDDDDEDDEDDEDEDWDEDDEDDEDDGPSISSALGEIDDKSWKKICNKLGDYSFPERMAYILVIAGGCEDADGDTCREYLEEVAECFDLDTDELIDAVSDDIDIEESLKLFNKVLPDDLKTAIAYAVNNVLEDSDDEAGQELVNYVSKWID